MFSLHYKICLSSIYWGDLVKSETGKTAQEFIQLKMENVAKNALVDSQLNAKRIAEMLGFSILSLIYKSNLY